MKLYVIELQFAGQIWQLLGKSRQSDTVAVVTATQHKSPVSYFVHIFNIGSSFVLYFVNWWTKKTFFSVWFLCCIGLHLATLLPAYVKNRWFGWFVVICWQGNGEKAISGTGLPSLFSSVHGTDGCWFWLQWHSHYCTTDTWSSC